MQINDQIARLETTKCICNLAEKVIFLRCANKENVLPEFERIAPALSNILPVSYINDQPNFLSNHCAITFLPTLQFKS